MKFHRQRKGIRSHMSLIIRFCHLSFASLDHDSFLKTRSIFKTIVQMFDQYYEAGETVSRIVKIHSVKTLVACLFICLFVMLVKIIC